MPRNFLSIGLLVVIIVGALWLIDSPPEQFQPQPDPDPDALTLVQYFNNMQTLEFDSEGLLEYHFNAQRIEHRKVLSDPEAQTTALVSQPRMMFYEQGQPQWQVQAEQGQTQLDATLEEELLLQDNVQIQQISENNPVLITSNSLWLNPSRQLARTDDYVELTSSGVVSTGRGLNADLERETFTLLAETRTRYEKSDR